MTKKFCVVVLAITGELGVTLMEVNVGTCTVTTELPVTVSKVAEIVAVPGVVANTRPAVLVVATVGAEEDQFTTPLMFCVLPSLKLPLALNCWNNPATIVGFPGETAMERTVAFVTVSEAEALSVPEVAVIVEPPAPTPEASPALTVATLIWAEVQVTREVTS